MRSFERNFEINLVAMDSSPVYMDYNATTPVDERVLETMLPYFSQHFGNASSRGHVWGRDAAAAVELARRQVATLIGAEPGEIIFTSGATESINLALKGVFETYKSKGTHLICEQTAHSAVINTCKHLAKSGAEITWLPVNADGLPDMEELKKALRPSTLVVAITTANNETGVLQPLDEISGLVHANGSILFTDATQAVGKMPVNVHQPKVDLLAMSGHKIYGPKGIGALYVRRKQPRVSLSPILDGGGQENGLRSGTLNVPGIVGCGKAAELCAEDINAGWKKIALLRNLLEAELLKIEGTHVNGHTKFRLPNVTNVMIENINAAAVLQPLNTVLGISTGSACSTSSTEPSHVLKAMGRSDEEARSSFRFSLGRFTTEDEVRRAISLFSEQVMNYRNAFS